jgi:hypothetical protein
MDVLFHHSETSTASDARGPSLVEQMARARDLSKALSERECEEMAADREPPAQR